jgi:hypothetical protein
MLVSVRTEMQMREDGVTIADARRNVNMDGSACAELYALLIYVQLCLTLCSENLV